MNQIYIT